MCGVYSTHGRDEKYIIILVGKDGEDHSET
jgi:hypothetical protein